jgi:hypothetical protein
MRTYAIWGTATSPEHSEWVRHIGAEFERDGFRLVDDVADADFVLNMFDPDDPKAFRRASRGTYSASFYELESEPEDVLKASYPMLVRTLANVVVLHVPGQGVWFTTMERGTYRISDDPAEVFDRLAPLAKSKLVIDNEFVPDLEPELWSGDEVTADIGAAGKRMGDLDLLPAPFPVHEFLDERDLRHVMRLYQVGGLSYGNLSARKDATRFWMSASGVDKTQLEVPGRDILLVTGYDEANARMLLSVPPGIEPRLGRRDRALDDLPGAPRRRGDPPRARLDEGDRRHRHQLPLRHAGAGGERRGADRPRAGSRARRHRPAQPRHHRHRRQPDGDPGPHRAEGPPPGPDDLNGLRPQATDAEGARSRSRLSTTSSGTITRSLIMHQVQTASITNSCRTTR